MHNVQKYHRFSIFQIHPINKDRHVMLTLNATLEILIVVRAVNVKMVSKIVEHLRVISLSNKMLRCKIDIIGY